MFTKQTTRSCTVRIYKSMIRIAITWGCEIWALKNLHEQKLSALERKVMRKISGTIKDQNGTWRIITNEEIDLLIENANMFIYI